MALSQAQNSLKNLVSFLEDQGKTVRYAIHPVAGRMPGHMNVLLAEVDIPYDNLLEMDEANPMFKETDVTLVVGANDVVNPAANTAVGTPIYGMPVLSIQDSKHIIICNMDDAPGYAGVDNPLYKEAQDSSEQVLFVKGDAKDNLDKISTKLSELKATAQSDERLPLSDKDFVHEAAQWLQEAKQLIVVPGYGLAVSQAQSHLKALIDQLEKSGVEVEYAIHPVAGRMPGHMNVLLAEVDVPYEKLKEMEEVNPKFAEADVVLAIGANDVINPAANTEVGTPIYGMPVLHVDQGKRIIICNFDMNPGYAGVDNPLYKAANQAGSKVLALIGDAKESIQQLAAAL